LASYTEKYKIITEEYQLDKKHTTSIV